MSTNLEELKKLREHNFLKHKKKKRDYYLKSKEKNIDSKYKKFKEIDYEKELNSNNFTKNIKIIAKKQKKHIDDRKEQILQKMTEYKEKKQAYYKVHREERLEYDKVYRETKKDSLKEYRREYYKRNKESILERQKNKRKKRIIDGK
jgi:hypothetical protein